MYMECSLPVLGLAKAFPGGWAAHLDSDQIEENMKKIKENLEKIIGKM